MLYYFLDNFFIDIYIISLLKYVLENIEYSLNI